MDASAVDRPELSPLSHADHVAGLQRAADGGELAAIAEGAGGDEQSN